MAFYNRYKRRYQNVRKYGVRSSARWAAGRGYSRAKKANETIGIYNPGTEYIAGIAVGGLTNIDDQIPFYVKVGLACAPLRGGIGGKISRFMKGMVVGDILQAKLNLPNLTAGALPDNKANRVLPGAI